MSVEVGRVEGDCDGCLRRKDRLGRRQVLIVRSDAGGS